MRLGCCNFSLICLLLVALEKELEQTKLELRLERQNKFATNKQKSEGDDYQQTTEHLQEDIVDDRLPMIATTTSSSTSVKALWRVFFMLKFLAS